MARVKGALATRKRRKRILKLAKNLVNYSCKVKKGEKVMI